MASFADALTTGPVLLDGGLATQLEAAGHNLSDELWSARLLADDPAAIVAAHREFLRAGAEVITTASYQATVDGLARHGHDGEALLRRSVALARSAAGEVAGPRWVAASVGPYGAALADGSEYRGNYGLTTGELVRFHRDRMAILADAGPDVLALETVPDVREAEALLVVLDDLKYPAWLSYSVAGATTRAGQPLAEAFGLVRGHPYVVAVGVNCSRPADAGAAVAVAAGASAKPVVVYPNSGEEWDAVARRWTGTPAPFSVGEWVLDGARIVGGCCRITPADIATMTTALRHVA